MRKILQVDEVKFLMFHPESESLFLLSSKRQAEQAAADGAENVTGDKVYEDMWKKHGKYVAAAKASNTEGKDDRPFHVKYRPLTLKTVVGQKEVVASITNLIGGKSVPHTYLFTGPSGTGKTTLARILASQFHCASANIIEVDAATNTGIDAMRAITDTLRYSGFGESPNKMIIIDEAHALSKAAWQSLLKAVEEPPPHVYFCLCTTDPGKIPDTIKTRCHSYLLKPLKFADLMDLLEAVVKKENLDTPDTILQMVTVAAEGSPRQALVMLSMIRDCTDKDEAARLLESPTLYSSEVVDLCRALVQGGLKWAKVQEVLAGLSETSPESIRIIIVNYLNACLMKAKSDRDIPRLLDILSNFSKPCNPSDKIAPILLALGNFIFPPGD